MCIDFYLLKKLLISLTTHLGPSLQSVLYSRAPLGPVSLFHRPELKLQGHINFKVSFAHWVIFRIQEGHSFLCTMDTCQGLVAVILIGLDSRLPQCSENCKHGNGLIYFFVVVVVGFFLHFLSARWKCGINVEEIIRPQSYFRHS